MEDGIWAQGRPQALGRFLLNSISSAVSSCEYQEAVDGQKAITKNISSKSS